MYCILIFDADIKIWFTIPYFAVYLLLKKQVDVFIQSLIFFKK